MKHSTVSAPAKLLLFGEHAAVYGHPCIVTAINRRIFVTISPTTEKKLYINANDVGIKNYTKDIASIGKGTIPKEVQFIELAIKEFVKTYPKVIKKFPGIQITTKSDFSSQFGFGSSSAVTVATIKALAVLFDIKMNEKKLFTMAYKTVFAIQKRGSGVDIAAAVYGGTLFFITGGKTVKKLPIDTLPLIVGYSGIKADTVTLLNQVKQKSEKYSAIVADIYNSIGNIVKRAKQALVTKDFVTVGELMNINQGYLESLGVSTQKLSNMIYAARSAGAYGAKLSGAGGGDCMLAVSTKATEKKVKQAIVHAGGEVLEVYANAEGVRVEL